jgi:hypothetical protein
LPEQAAARGVMEVALPVTHQAVVVLVDIQVLVV